MDEDGVRGSVMIRYFYQHEYADNHMESRLGDAMGKSQGE